MIWSVGEGIRLHFTDGLLEAKAIGDCLPTIRQLAHWLVTRGYVLSIPEDPNIV